MYYMFIIIVYKWKWIEKIEKEYDRMKLLFSKISYISYKLIKNVLYVLEIIRLFDPNSPPNNSPS